ncbi:hypothetical protein ACFW17_13340 [Streptomyces sp. NPDC058961]|uniref:hypothetical protein n=1 Tax=Streptomyces sp. NPDC058961 TaxID=3346680 RepID=UPI0036AE77E1
MHSNIHLLLHHQRAAELAARTSAAAALPRKHHLRVQLGWLLVELGLRLAEQAPRRQARLA